MYARKMAVTAIALVCFASSSLFAQEITPYKFTDDDLKHGLPAYTIPASSRYTVPRTGAKEDRENNAPDIVYYLSRPPTKNLTQDTFPIAILCSGSSQKSNITSIIHFHRYLLQEFFDLNIAVVTVEQRGVDGQHVDKDEFMEHYTRSERLLDHHTVIKHLKNYPPAKWDGRLIFLGVSEGGPLVTTLTAHFSDITVATINWSGAGDWSWREELWAFIQNLYKTIPWYGKPLTWLPRWIMIKADLYLPKSKQDLDFELDAAIQNPTTQRCFMGMTYKYHADALVRYPEIDYTALKTPLLVVAGARDSIIDSCDAFVRKAQNAGVPISYQRVEDMDHYIRKRPEIIAESFEWLKIRLQAAHLRRYKDHEGSMLAAQQLSAIVW